MTIAVSIRATFRADTMSSGPGAAAESGISIIGLPPEDPGHSTRHSRTRRPRLDCLRPHLSVPSSSWQTVHLSLSLSPSTRALSHTPIQVVLHLSLIVAAILYSQVFLQDGLLALLAYYRLGGSLGV
ncbi:hypothetical protein J6590_009927 [Homalodisca vitripennis]|nr:hypothetical protein J6590_009927 [Homalodisca vitripennis]